MTRTRLSVAERRHTLIDVASPLFASSSYSEVSTQDIAQAAGVSVGLIFHHFGSKAGLYAAVVAQREEELDAAVAEAVEGLPPNTSTRDKVRAAAGLPRSRCRSPAGVGGGGAWGYAAGGPVCED